MHSMLRQLFEELQRISESDAALPLGGLIGTVGEVVLAVSDMVVDLDFREFPCWLCLGLDTVPESEIIGEESRDNRDRKSLLC